MLPRRRAGLIATSWWLRCVGVDLSCDLAPPAFVVVVAVHATYAKALALAGGCSGAVRCGTLCGGAKLIDPVSCSY